MYKVGAVLKTAEKYFLERADQHIQVVRRQTLSIISADLIQTILKSISEKKVLRMNYSAKYSEEKTDRMIEPIGISFISNRRHLIAYCQIRKDYRDFRIDRTEQLKITDGKYKNEHPAFQKYLEDMAKKQDLKKVVILVLAFILPTYYFCFVMIVTVNQKRK